MPEEKDCDYPNCHMPAVRRVGGKDLCAEHADGFQEFLQRKGAAG